MLGTSRGGANIKEIVKRIDLWGLNMVSPPARTKPLSVLEMGLCVV